jgi:CubicO group peptidase (beta-lactamase class C family)
MKKTLSWSMILLIFLTFLGMNSLRAQENSEEEVEESQGFSLQNPPTVQYKTLDDFMNGVLPSFMTSNHGVGIAIGVIQNGQPKTYYFGETAKGNGKKPNGSTLFMIGSISKTFTATLLALYVQQHLVDLSDTLQKYVPAGVTVPTFDGQLQQITLESLATHTSGLPRKPPIPPGSAGNFSVSELFNSLNQTTLGSVPGNKYLYSNFGFSVLGQALARVGTKSWAELNQQEITSPLGMIDTKVESQLNGGELGRRAQGNHGNVMVPGYTMPGFPAGNPAGGLYSTLDDMMKYLSYAMGLTNTPLNSLRQSLFQPRHPAGPNGKVGLAWQTNPLLGTSDHVIWKGGSTRGFVSYIGFIPETHNGVVLLLNFSSKQMVPLAQEILKYLTQQPVSPHQFQIQQSTPLLENHRPGPAGPGPVENQKIYQ